MWLWIRNEKPATRLGAHCHEEIFRGSTDALRSRSQAPRPRNQNRASRFRNIRPHSRTFLGPCERKFGHSILVPFPPQALQLPLPDLPLPKHGAHQRTRSSETHFGHRSPSIAWLLIGLALWTLQSISSAR